MFKKTLFALSILSLANVAFAEDQSKFYIEAGYAGIQYKEAGYYATPVVGVLRFGSNINQNLSVEGVIGTTIKDATFYVGYTPVTARYDSIYGVYLKAKTEIAPNFDVFARLGYMHAAISVSFPGFSGSSGGSDLSYGIGAQFSFTPTVYGQLDYMTYYNKNGATANGPSLGLGVKF